MLGFAFVALGGDTDFVVFQCHRAGDEDAGNDPDVREKQDAKNQPGQGEATDAARHQLGSEVVEQRQA